MDFYQHFGKEPLDRGESVATVVRMCNLGVNGERSNQSAKTGADFRFGFGNLAHDTTATAV
jgi:hypothetical protein